MKKILVLSIALIAVIALSAGGTWAYFTDAQTSTGNLFSAGTLDIGLDKTGAGATTANTTANFTASTWAPGTDSASGTLGINNAGSLAVGHLSVTFTLPLGVVTTARPANIPDSYGVNPGATWDAAGNTDDFDYMIIVKTATYDGGAITDIVNGTTTLHDLVAHGAYALGSLAAGTEKSLVMQFTFSSSATNGCQGNTANMTATVTATQN